MTSGFFSTGTFAGTLRLTNHLALVTENRLQFAESGSPLMSYDQTDSQPLEEHPGLRASVKLAGNYAFLAPWTAQGRCEDNAGTKDTEAWR